MANIFNSIKIKKEKRNTFNLTHDFKFSARMGNLIPVLCTEVVPGDKWNIGADSLIRFAPLVAPVMHRFDATIHYFFVPNRLVWSQFPDWIANNVQATAPYIRVQSTFTADQLKFMEYMGVPRRTYGESDFIDVNALPFAAYQLIYNEYYRDQNLIDPVDTALTGGSVLGAQLNGLLTQRKRAWEHDYFTSSLPWAQKGEQVEIPLGDVMLKEDWDGNPHFETQANTNFAGGALTSQGIPNPIIVDGPLGEEKGAYNPDGSLVVGSTTINNLRRAFKLQEWLEKNARGGTRFIELILSHFGVRSSDKRLQRPEYITGVKQPIVVSEVLNTAGQVLPDGEEGQPLPQGNMSGHAVSVGQGHSGSFFAEEHGFIIGIMSVMPKPAYMQGLHRQFSKLDPLDYYWPSFAHIGEQEVKASEIYISAADPATTFGYVPRYAEYKYIPSRVAGDFTGTLDYWHLARKFDTEPQLSQEFIECNPDDLTRIFAVETGDDELFCHVLHKIQTSRLMPVFGTPMI